MVRKALWAKDRFWVCPRLSNSRQEVAESAGADLRILVSHRPAAGLLASTTQHRHFAPYGQEALALAHNARVLAAQLRSLDAAFFRCVAYDALPVLPPGLAAWLVGADLS